MSMSGIKLSDEAVVQFNTMKMSKSYSFILLKISSDEKQIDLEKSFPKKGNSVMEEIAGGALPSNSCRYLLLDFVNPATSSENSKGCLIFILWAPENSTVREKMLYAASTAAVTSKLVGLQFKLQASSLDELTVDGIEDEIKSR